MNSSEIKCVIFDMDGTITKPYIDFIKLRAAIGIPEGFTNLLDYRKYLLEQDDKKGVEHYDEVLHAFEVDAAEHAELNHGFADLYNFMKKNKIKIGILTRNSSKSLKAVTKKLKLKIDAPISRDHVSVPKPNPEGVYKISEITNTKLENIIFVGDHLFDIEVGKNAGIRTVFLSNGTEPPFSVDPDFRLDFPNELIPIIKMLNKI